MLKTIDLKYVICCEENLKVVRAAARKCGVEDKRIFVLEDEVDGARSVKALVEEGRKLGDKKQVEPLRLPKGKKNSKVFASAVEPLGY